MMYAGKSMPISPDRIFEVRRANLETQAEFGMRFKRSRFSVLRWECHGTKFKYQSAAWHAWQQAIARAVKLQTERGASNDEIDRLRELRLFSR